MKKEIKMGKKSLGMSDIPIFEENDDRLDMRKYVDGLVEFVKDCCTPMSIALQGDWGTGKTSFINRMQKRLDKEDGEIVTVYFNTWQYSQFNMSDSLYYSFVQCIVNCIEVKRPEQSAKVKKILTSLGKIFLDITKQIVENKTGCNLNIVGEELNELRSEKMENITKLKEDYRNLINETAGNDGRVIIFIDDLDRLNPEIAVALLETIKLFMDVEKSVFVLAIDYDVVVRGVQAKYGKDMDDEKCRSFFDKIIQLPFRMPTENYKIKKLLEKNDQQSNFEGYTDILGTLIESTLGSSPRTFKRIINSYELLKIVERKKDDPYEETLLLINLILQMYSYESYLSFLENECNDEGSFNKFREKYETEEIQPVFEALDSIMKKSKKGKKVIEDFWNEINASSEMMSLVTNTQGSKVTTKVTKISVFGNEKFVNSGVEAMCLTVEGILNKYPNKIDDIINKYDTSITTDESKTISRFESKKEIKVDTYQEKIYVGVHSGLLDKIKLVKNILSFVGESDDYVKWYDVDRRIL